MKFSLNKTKTNKQNAIYKKKKQLFSNKTILHHSCGEGSVIEGPVTVNKAQHAFYMNTINLETD